MSNAMRSGKRWLAGVAAGALVASVVPIAVVATATSAQADVSATVTPVRVTFTGTTLEQVPFSNITWAASEYVANGSDTMAVTLSDAPSPTATLGFFAYNSANDAGRVNFNPTTPPGSFTTDNSGTAPLTGGQAVRLGATAEITQAFNASADPDATPGVGVAASQPGTYTGQLRINNAAGVRQETVDFTFTTTGRATSLTLTPASQTIAVGGITNLVAELRDAAGNRTQPLWADSLSLTVTGGTTVPPATISSANLATGRDVIAYTQNGVAGIYTVTATPLGTLPSAGVTAQTASISASGTISNAPVTGMRVSVPANAANTGSFATNDRAAAVPSGTSAVTVAITGGAANSTLRFQLVPVAAGSTVNGSTTATFAQVTTDSTGAATLPITIGGGGLITGAQTRVNQVNVTNGNVLTGVNQTQITITQTNANITANSVNISPTGAVSAAVGSTVPVTVVVQTQFGAPVSAAQVIAYRGATVAAPSVQIFTAATNASGVAELTLSGATGITAGTTEQYSFQVIGGGAALNLLNQIQVTYTASGAVTAMQVNVGGGGLGITTPITNTTTSIAVIPEITVPFAGTVAGISNGTYVQATQVSTPGNAGNYAQFTPLPNPGNPVTVTVPEGLKVVTAAQQAAGGVLWSGGAQSATIASGANVFVFGTKVGVHRVTFTSGAITTTAAVNVVSPAAASYNVALSPQSQRIAEGAFGTVTATVTDVFGNPVDNSGNDANYGITVSVAGPALLAGQNQSLTLTTGADGTVSVVVLASGGQAGEATLTVAPSATAVAFANGAPVTRAWSSVGYVPPTGATAPVKSGTAKATITPREELAITITGERATVSGKSGIKVDGIVDGIDDGSTVTPFIRFPGQTTFEAGSARPTIANDEFTWQRKTGKRVTVYVELTGDSSVRSNRVVIQAS